MFPWTKPNAPALDAWLAAATRGLCEEARERISEEIRTHVADTRVTLRTDGVIPEEASRIALQRLGSPRRARRTYKRQYLRKSEVALYMGYERHMRWGENSLCGLGPLEWVWAVFAITLLCVNTTEHGLSAEGIGNYVFIMGFVLAGWCGLIGRTVSRRFDKHSGFAAFLAAQLMFIATWTIHSGLKGVYKYMHNTDPNPPFNHRLWGAILMSVFVGVAAKDFYHTWSKTKATASN